MKIGDFKLGAGRTFLVAEAGINHGGNLGRAHLLIEAAADAGADAVKFQTFQPAELGCSPEIGACALPVDVWPVLARHATARGILFFSTPFDCESVDLLDPLVPAFKIASGEITNDRLLRHVASKGKPVILSTGMAARAEIHAATAVLGWSRLAALLHCVSSYPAPTDEMNLRVIRTMRTEYQGAPIGLSDHTLGDEIAIAAVAIGAVLVEKHLTLSRGAAGPDHAASMEPREFAAMVQRIRNVEAAMGDGIKRCMPSEIATRRTARRDPATGKRP